MTPPLIFGPIPAYSNPPITPGYYQPQKGTISGITLGLTTIVTTVENMRYVVGQLVRLIIPPLFGCRELNERQAYIINVISPTSFELNLDSRSGNPYVASTYRTPAQILAIGDVNTGIQNASSTFINVIPGSFNNISPNT
jgi:hypothetical protein